jgi:type IV secretory pathway VirB4 component
MQGVKVIVIDPEREYKLLTESVGGKYIKLSAKSKEKINPFDLATTFHNRSDLSEHAQDLTEVISLMAEGLSAREKAAVDKAILKVYSSSKNEMPLLEDLYHELHDMGRLTLCERLEKYISGSLASVFNAQTNIERRANTISERIHVEYPLTVSNRHNICRQISGNITVGRMNDRN